MRTIQGEIMEEKELLKKFDEAIRVAAERWKKEGMALDGPTVEEYRKMGELSDLAKAMIESGELKLNLNGHFFTGNTKYITKENYPEKFTYIQRSIYSAAFAHTFTNIDDLVKKEDILKNPKNAEKFVDFMALNYISCTECGEFIGFQTNGKELKAISRARFDDLKKDNKKNASRCKYENGFPEYKLRFECTSGKVIIADDVRNFIQEHPPDIDKYELFSKKGEYNYAKFYEKRGILHGMIGNSMPHIFKTKNALIIGRNDEENTLIDPVSGNEAKIVGQIITSVWSYSIIDFGRAKSLSKKGAEYFMHKGNVITIKPGIYELTHKFNQVNHQSLEQPKIYAKMELIERI